MEYNIGDIVRTKKQHPCGSKLWEITRVGVDFKLKCQGCGHVVMLDRQKALKMITKKIEVENDNKKIEKINKGFAVLAKQMKTDILPIGLTGCEQYNWIPFKGKIKIAVGEIISYNQEYDEIIDEWGQKVADLIGYEYIKQEEQEKEKVTSA